MVGLVFWGHLNPFKTSGFNAGGECFAHFVPDPVFGGDGARRGVLRQVGGPPGEGAVRDDRHVGMLDDLEVDDGRVALEVVVGRPLEVAAHALDVIADEEHFVLLQVGNQCQSLVVVVERQAHVAAAQTLELHLGVVGAPQVHGHHLVRGEELAVFPVECLAVLGLDFECLAYLRQGVLEVHIALEEALVVALRGLGVDGNVAVAVAHLVVHEPLDKFLAHTAVGALGPGVGVYVARQGVEAEVAQFEAVFIAAGPWQGDAAARAGKGVLEHLVPHLAEKGYDTHRL